MSLLLNPSSRFAICRSSRRVAHVRAAAISSQAGSIAVSPAPAQRVRGAHWVDDTPRSFKNPWKSFRTQTFSQVYPFVRGMLQRVASDEKRDKPRINELVPRTTPSWGRPEDRDLMKATWMGHASYLVEMPREPSTTPSKGTADSGRGVTILIDPAWSMRASPIQFFGPARYQSAAATVDEIPEVDIICISHNHYDHQDTNTLTSLYKRFSERPPLLVIGLNGAGSLPSCIPKDRIVEMDWWEEREVEVEGKGKVAITCTPAQHVSKRSPFDTNKALWAGYAIRSVPSGPATTSHNLWFSGDTGYRAVDNESHDPKDNLGLPHCPAFEELGDRLGPFSLALIPIGAYEPRSMLSSLHTSPLDAVRISKDVKAKKALGIHWGSFHMSWEPVDEPPKLLKAARDALGVTEEQFGVPVLGETRTFVA